METATRSLRRRRQAFSNLLQVQPCCYYNSHSVQRGGQFVPEKRGQAPPKKTRIYHSKGDKDDWRSGLAAAPSTTSASSSSKRPQPHQEEDQEGKRHHLLAPRIRRSLQQASGIGIGAGNPGIGKAMDKARSHGRDSTGNRAVLGHMSSCPSRRKA